MQVGPRWTYKLRLQEEGGQSALVLAQQSFATQEEAKAAGDQHLKSEIEKRSS